MSPVLIILSSSKPSQSSDKTNKGARPKQSKPKKQDHRSKSTHHHDKKKAEYDGKKADGDVEEALEDIPGYAELKKQIDAFVVDENRHKMEFPSGLTSRERFLVHEVGIITQHTVM